MRRQQRTQADARLEKDDQAYPYPVEAQVEVNRHQISSTEQSGDPTAPGQAASPDDVIEDFRLSSVRLKAYTKMATGV